jgi:CTP-dependent riboflavin kinase
MKDHWKISGIIVSGVKQGAFFTQLEWVQTQCLEKLGFKPWPGTLNLKIAADDLSLLERLWQRGGIELVPPNSDYCSGFVFPVSVEGIAGAVVVPAEDVRVHGKNVIEIIAPKMLKEVLGVKDGDWVTLTISNPNPNKPERMATKAQRHKQ